MIYGLRLVPQGAIPRDTALSIIMQPLPEGAVPLVGISELPYDLIFALYADIAAEDVIGAAIVPRDVTLPVTAPASKATCATAPASASIFEIKQNDIKVGEITFEANKTEGTIVVGHLDPTAPTQLIEADVPILAGDLIEIIASADQFDALSNIRVTLVAIYSLPKP